MKVKTRVQLSAMMFLQYFLWGAWWVTLGSYMVAIGFSDIIGRTYATQGWGAIIAPLFVGMIADRYFSAQRVMGTLHLIGAGLLFYLSTITDSRLEFYLTTLIYMATFMPTLPLSNTVAFNAMRDTQKEFPPIRVLGTIGWIVAGLALSFVLAPLVLAGDSPITIEQTVWPVRLAAGAALLLGLFAFTLPDAPPSAAGTAPKGIVGILGLDVFRSGATHAFWVFIACSLLICVPLAFYYGYTNAFLVDKGAPNAVALQSLGQVSEIVFMLILPLMFVRLGIKYVLLVGMVAWAVRYVLFALGYSGSEIILGLAVTGILLHGICYDFFFVAGQIYVDKSLPRETRGRAQSFLALTTLGVGALLGGELANAVVNANSADGAVDWRTVWLIPAALSAAVTVAFLLLFRNAKAQQNDSS